MAHPAPPTVLEIYLMAFHPYLQNMTRRLKYLRSLIRPGVIGYMSHEVNNKTLYAIIAVCSFLGGTAKASFVFNVLYHEISSASKII
jgi:hypothetical protein